MKSIILTLLILSISFSVKSHSQGYVTSSCWIIHNSTSKYRLTFVYILLIHRSPLSYVDMICRTMSSVETISDTTNCKYDSYNSPCEYDKAWINLQNFNTCKLIFLYRWWRSEVLSRTTYVILSFLTILIKSN